MSTRTRTKPKTGLDERPKSPPEKTSKASSKARLNSLQKQHEEEKKTARLFISPSTVAAVATDSFLKPFGKVDLFALMECLGESMARVNQGDMNEVESMLIGQAQALQIIFANLSGRAISVTGMKQFEMDLRLALKAQAQCCRTLEVLAGIKNPGVLFAKQANFANGPQQVNNGMPTPQATGPACEEAKVIQNELLEE
jgi:hypothetical protein